MSTHVVVNTYSHSVTYVTGKLLNTLRDIVRRSGLNPEKISTQWDVLNRGISAWLASRHLQQVHLEVFQPQSNALVGRWDLQIAYGYAEGDGTFWFDPDVIAYHIKKQGLWPSSCDYRIVITTSAGRPQVDGWGDATLLSTDGFVKQSIGTGINGSGLGVDASYWRKAGK